jgi:predicted RNA binding protein with dsRBD fold (UPF0201 family)
MVLERKVKIVDEDNSGINVASEEAIILLRRILKVLESNSVVDSLQRQRVVVDSGAITASIASSQTLTTVTGVTSLAQLSGVDAKWVITDQARNAYANSIRSKLMWS